MEQLLELIDFLGLKEYFVSITAYVFVTRTFFKPLFSFWLKFISPYIKIRPTERLLKNPIYKAFAYILDWTSSVKLPQEVKRGR